MSNKVRSITNKVYDKLKKSVDRFPETIFISFLLVVILIMIVHDIYDEEVLENISLTIGLGIPMSAVIKLIVERFKLNKKIRIIIDTITVILLLIYYFLLPNISNQFIQQYTVLIGVLLISFTMIPYFYSREVYQVYLLKILNAFFVTFLYSIVLYLGIASMIFAVDSLFSLNLVSEIYIDIYIIIAGTFSITNFLGSIPSYRDNMWVELYPKVYRVLFIYILMPIAITYTIILHAYFIKVAITGTIPEGLIGNLVIWYALASIVLIFFTLPLKDSFANKFNRYFPLAMIVPTIMMIVVIIIRVNGYGITVTRYYAIIASIWIIGVVCYLIISKKIHSVNIVISGIVLLMVSAFGPLNAYNITINSQNNKFEKYLSNLKVLENNKLVIKDKTYTNEEQKKILSFIRYFENIDKLKHIEVLPEGFTLENMEDYFGFEYNYYIPKTKTNYINYFYDLENNVINVKDVDYIINLQLNNKMIFEQEDIMINYNNKIFTVQKNNQTIYANDIGNIANKVHIKLDNKQANTLDDVSVIDENDKLVIKYIIENMNGEWDEAGKEFNNLYMDLTILITFKNK